MHKFITLACIGAITLSTPVFAQTQQDEKIKSDVQAIDKDNAALQNDQQKLAQHRTEKEQDKANGSYGAVAVDKMKIGTVHAAIAEKKAERGIDRNILKHDQDNQTSDSRGSQTYDRD